MNDVLVLNASEEILNIASMKRAVALLLAGKAEVLHEAADGFVRSGSRALPAPTVVRMRYYVSGVFRRVSLTKKNVIIRDDGKCSYCGVRGQKGTMTVDHIMPKSRGGPQTWRNLATSCQRCNNRKGNRTPEEANMKLRITPYTPKHLPWSSVRRNTVPGEWIKYLELYERGL